MIKDLRYNILLILGALFGGAFSLPFSIHAGNPGDLLDGVLSAMENTRAKGSNTGQTPTAGRIRAKGSNTGQTPTKGEAELFGSIADAMMPAGDNSALFGAVADAMMPGGGQTGLFLSVADAMTMDSALDFLNGLYDEAGTDETTYYRYHSGIAGEAVLPVSGIISSRFGYRPRFKRMHKGIDICLQVGDTVVAALDGVIARVANDPRGYGNFIVIRHNGGLETRYAHLSRSLVYPGLRVWAGDPIALGGNTGNSTGPHLHFETRHNGVAFDPSDMFDFNMPGGMQRHRTLADLDRLNPKNNNLTTKPGKGTYIVRAGDSLTSISRATGVSVLNLCRLNMISTTERLEAGRMIKLR